MTYSSEVLADSPVAYWRLGEASGTVAVDETGSHDGTYIGNPTLGASGLLVNDADTAIWIAPWSPNSGVSVPYNAALIPTSALSLEAWFTVDSGASGASRLISTDQTVATQSYQLFFYASGDKELWFRVKIGGAWYGGGFGFSPIQDNSTIYHAAATWDGSLLRLFIDGVEQATTYAASGILDASTRPILIGTGRADWAGSVDEVAIYGSALSASRIAAHYDAGITISGTPADATSASAADATLGTIGAATVSDATSDATSATSAGATSAVLTVSGTPAATTSATDAAATSQDFSTATPAERTHIIPAESRISIIPAESRISIIPAESRITTIGAP